ncbi:MAG: ankyrin repeat domain-containing protein, partial [Myxococcota bacterium]|nr:ankyrin repeat domain-containing protein [Myxococcota bacterium]
MKRTTQTVLEKVVAFMENGKLYVSVDSLNSSDDLKTEIEEMRAGHENHVHRENRQNAADTLCLSLSQHEQTTDPYASYSFEITYSYAMHRYVVTTKRSPQEFGSETTSENDFEDPRGVAGYIASFNIRKWFLGGLTPGQQSLLDAIDNDDLQGVKESLKERADINQRGIHGDPCLVRAVKFCGTELVKTLLESGPDLEMTDQAQNTALHWSIIKNRNDVFNLLLRSGANINALNDEGENGLMIAAGFNNLDALNFFLRKGFNPALRNKSGKDALEMAISLGQEKTARLLMENGAVLKPDEAFGLFLKACELGYLEMVVLLADTGVALDQAGCIIPELRDSDATGLMTAASLG